MPLDLIFICKVEGGGDGDLRRGGVSLFNFFGGWEEGSGDGDFRIGGGTPFEFFYLWGTFLNIGKSIRGGI